MGPRLQAKIFLHRASQIFKFKDSDESCLADSESAVNLAIMSLTFALPNDDSSYNNKIFVQLNYLYFCVLEFF